MRLYLLHIKLKLKVLQFKLSHFLPLHFCATMQVVNVQWALPFFHNRKYSLYNKICKIELMKVKKEIIKYNNASRTSSHVWMTLIPN
jgi:hypothetical protein